MNKQQLKEEILTQIEKPRIPMRKYLALDFGIIPDSANIQTKQLQTAIDTISEGGGGTLVLSSGKYRTGALRLKSRVELHLEKTDTILSFVNEDAELHYPTVFSHWEATPCYNFSPLLYACDAHDIAVTGDGTMDGGADEHHWWNWHHQVENAWSADKVDLQMEDRLLLRRMNMEGVPIEERRFGPGHYLRPNFIQPIRCKRILLQGFTLHHSPMWQLNPVMCQSLTIDGVTLSSHGANSDGCDPESCNGVHICNCRFDTGDDCISLKSGRDRDGRIANIPCENVLIEQNEFADGHGGIALGSEMSGGIRRVLAIHNRFSSPNLTYALRLKTNARRGGRVEDIILADCVMDHVHGAAVHGTMLYEDGRNGTDLPEFHNITIENIVAHGGDYGIFLEAFEEVPITGLVLNNIKIDGVTRPMRCMNWEEPVIEQVVINGKEFPRPIGVRILGLPVTGENVTATAQNCGKQEFIFYRWSISPDGKVWNAAGEGTTCCLPEASIYLRVEATDAHGNTELSHTYRVISREILAGEKSEDWKRLFCRGMIELNSGSDEDLPVTRGQLAQMMMPLVTPLLPDGSNWRYGREEAVKIALEAGFLSVSASDGYCADGFVTRQEMATVAMQACGVNYRNASSTMPECVDVSQVGYHYGTNVARALYFGFMELEEDGCFLPESKVCIKEAIAILNRVADFAGL